jgi:hypothetical protein
MFKTAFMLGIAIALGAGGCLSGCSSADAPAEHAYGTVVMALTSQVNGTTYRLRNAAFDVTGPTTTLLDTEQNPDLPVISTTLATGSYSISLRSGWALQRLNAGTYEPVQATLVSANPANFEIISGSTTAVVYSFQTDGTIVDIGTGTLALSIDVTNTGSGGGGDNCSVVTQAGCAAPLACYPLFDGTSVCAGAGSAVTGAPCQFINDCAAGGFCAQVGETPTCIAGCGLDGTGSPCPAGTLCSDAGLGGVLGACL